MSLPKVFIADSISQRGVDELTRDGALEAKVQTGLSETDLSAAIPDFAAQSNKSDRENFKRGKEIARRGARRRRRGQCRC
jgi:hypothetical protein